jgi:hypothetical protein
MIPFREGEMGDAEVPLIHGLHVEAELAEQSESLGERHSTTLAQFLVVIDPLSHNEKELTRATPVNCSHRSVNPLAGIVLAACLLSL